MSVQFPTQMTWEQFRDMAVIAQVTGPSLGQVWFVHHSGSDASGRGGSSDAPFATINYAVGKCVANKGDTIVVMEGHNESLTAATSLVVDVAGVSIIGLGKGHARPILDFDNTAATIEMDAANCRLSNVVLRASVSAVVVGINVDADDIELDNLEYTYEATGDDFLTMMDIDAVDRTHVHHCVFNTEPATAGCAEGIRLDDNEQTVIEHNVLNGQFSDAPIVAEGAAGKNNIIRYNMLYNSDTTDNNGMEIGVATTGILAHNVIGTLYATAVAALVDPGSMLTAENYTVNAIDEVAVKIPATTSA